MIILFDLDGTLIDSTDAIVLSFQDVFRFYNDPIVKEDEIKDLIGYPLEDMFEKLEVSTLKLKEYSLKYKEFYKDRSIPMTSLLPKAKEAIALASTFATIGIVTTKESNRTSILLKNLGLDGYFSVVIGRNDVINPKPNAEPILKALKILNLDTPKKECFMIGDTCLDIEAAKNANINDIGVLSGYAKKNKLQGCNATNIFETTYDAVVSLKYK
jgi:phosphoglycolate phosphatase